jgi:hypothetical protein
MGLSLVTGAPAWIFLLCLAAGFGYAFLLYRKSPLPEVSQNKVRILFAFRFLLVSAIAFLLMSPMVRTTRREIEKPIVVLATDASASMVQGADSAGIRKQIFADIEVLREGLSDAFDLRILQFGDRVAEGLPQRFDHKATDFGQLFNELDVRFAGRNTGAMIFITDGGFNRGMSPAYGPRRVQFPAYTLAYGDTSTRKDLAIGRIRNNRLAYLGNSFPIEVSLDAEMASGASSSLTIREDSVVVYNQPVQVAGAKFHANIPVYLDARKTGIRHYVIEFAPVNGEITTTNNKRDVFIEVVEEKEKILLLASAPHPDLAAIRNSLESGLHHDVKTVFAGEFSGAFTDYDLIILHGFPTPSGNGGSLISKVADTKLPKWFILTTNSAVNSLNEAGVPVGITQHNGQSNDLQASPDRAFSLFSPREELSTAIAEWPPLKAPFGIYKTIPGGRTWLYQKLGSVITDQPLLAFGEFKGAKVAVLCGEGVWRWRMTDYLDHGSHELSSEFIQQIVRYLSSQEDKGPFRVQCKNDFRETEPVVFDAQLFNESGQLVNEPEVRVSIRSAKGLELTYTMTRNGNIYQLNAGQLQVGRYSWKAEVKLGDKLYSRQGQFSVSSLQLEQAISRADHDAMRILAVKTGGELYQPGQAKRLVDRLLSNDQLKPVSYLRNSTEELLNEPWFFILIVVLLSTEWLIRKLSGAY